MMSLPFFDVISLFKNVGEIEKRYIMTHFTPIDYECNNISVKTVQTF
jgi:hypothetical protein